MKSLLVLVSAIAIFSADSRDFPDKPEISDNIYNDDQPPWLDGQISENQDEYFTDEPKVYDSIDNDQKPMDASMQLDNEREPVLTFTSELDQQPMKEENMRIEEKLRGSSCSSSVICNILGGSCIFKAIHCSGWLVSDGCNGTNCKCCIPGSLEIKTIGVELQSIKNGLARLKELPSAIENITNTDSVLRQELFNISKANYELKMELDTMKSNITNSDLDSKLDYVMKQGSLEIKTIGVELQSIKSGLARLKELPSAIENITNTDSVIRQELFNISKANSELKMELDSMKSNITHSDLDLKLDYVMNKGCISNGRFLFAPTNQCLKLLVDKHRSWEAANARCKEDGLQLAKPDAPILLRKYLVQVKGVSSHLHLGAKGTGSYFKWIRDGKSLSNSDAGWWPGYPGSQYSTSYCLDFVVHSNGINQGKVYYPQACSGSRYALCERIIG